MRGITVLNAALLIVGGLSATLTGNGVNELVFKIKPPVERKAAPEKTASADKTMADLTQKDSYFYDPSGKADPFRPLFSTERKPVSPSLPQPQTGVLLSPLQRIELSQLKLKGVILAPAGNKALVEDSSSGKVFILCRGTFVGTGFGQVKRILEDKVLIEEVVGTRELRFIVKK